MSADSTSGALGAAFLGVVQGLTEFLPVSSSGHLVLFQQFVTVGENPVLFDLVLHLGSLVPVLWFYRSHWSLLVTDPLQGQGPLLERAGSRLWIQLVAASIPTAMIGLLFEDVFKAMFKTPATLAVTFCITAGLLLLTRSLNDEPRRTLDWKVALLLGVVQGFAITPGISRSGSTIAAALLVGLSREEAARFSFLMSVPAIVGATAKEGLEAYLHGALTVADPIMLPVGFVAALVSGYGALVLLVQLVKRGGLHYFAWYLFAVAAFAGLLAGGVFG